MKANQDQILEKLDQGGNGIISKEAWRIISAEWHASGKSFADFVTASSEATPFTVADAPPAEALGTATTMPAGNSAAVEEKETKAMAADEVSVRALALPFASLPSLSSSSLVYASTIRYIEHTSNFTF